MFEPLFYLLNVVFESGSEVHIKNLLRVSIKLPVNKESGAEKEEAENARESIVCVIYVMNAHECVGNGSHDAPNRHTDPTENLEVLGSMLAVPANLSHPHAVDHS